MKYILYKKVLGEKMYLSEDFGYTRMKNLAKRFNLKKAAEQEAKERNMKVVEVTS